MAGKGPLPNDPDQRRRRNATKTTKEVVADGRLHGPELPSGIEWHDQTRIWWDNWRRSPQASTLQAVEWDFLLDTARIHSEFWLGDSTCAAELRLRVSKFGATLEDRARLRLRVTDPAVDPKQSKPAQTTTQRYAHLRSVAPAV